MTYRDRTLYQLALASQAAANVLKYLSEIESEYIGTDGLFKKAQQVQASITAMQDTVRPMPRHIEEDA